MPQGLDLFAPSSPSVIFTFSDNQHTNHQTQRRCALLIHICRIWRFVLWPSCPRRLSTSQHAWQRASAATLRTLDCDGHVMDVAACAVVRRDVSASENISTIPRPLKRTYLALRRSMSPSSRVREWGTRDDDGINAPADISAESGTSGYSSPRGRSVKRRRRAPPSPAYRPSSASSFSRSRSCSLGAKPTGPCARPGANTTTSATACLSTSASATETPLASTLTSAPASWRTPDRLLFAHLAARGREPLLPASWSHDFPTLPSSLFTSPATDGAEESALVSHRHGSAAHGARALSALLEVGPRARDALVRGSSGARAETLVRRGVETWWRWCLKDGRVGVEGGGVLVVEEGPLATKVEVLQQSMVARLRDLHEHWRVRVGTGVAPACYGIIVSHTVMAIVSLEEEEGETERHEEGRSRGASHEQDKAHTRGQEAPSAEHEAALAKRQEQEVDGALRTLAVLDFSDPAMDVWNALAVAIAGVHCRDVALAAAQGARALTVRLEGFQLGESDPDA